MIITVVKKINDIKEILDENFPVVEYCDCLSGYCGYSDAQIQYEISKTEKEISKAR
jgi:hypothetical protein